MIASLKIGSFQWLPSPLKAVNLLPDKKRRSFPQSQPWKLNVFQKIDRVLKKSEEYEAEQAASYSSFHILLTML